MALDVSAAPALFEHHEVAREMLGVHWRTEPQRGASIHLPHDERAGTCERTRLLQCARRGQPARRLLGALERALRTLIRAPDFILEPRAGVIPANHAGKIAEHGGFHQDDRHVALRVANPQLKRRIVIGAVRTVQIAPTMLRLLGLRPVLLQAVRREGTRPLPALTLRR